MVAECIFCKIVKGEITCHKICESDMVIAFLDINPINAGHTLVVPKEHHENIFDTPLEIIAKVWSTCQTIAKALRDELQAEGVNVGMNNLSAAGQAVFHTHLHVIPRYQHDGLRLWPHKSYQEGQAQEIAKRLEKRVTKSELSPDFSPGL